MPEPFSEPIFGAAWHTRTAPEPFRAPFNLHRWIEQNRDLLKPPVGNKLLFEDSEFIIMAVGGPNSRKDYHHDPGAEFFFQIEGDMVLKTIQSGRFIDVPIRQGEVYLLPSRGAPLAAASRRQRRTRGRAAPRGRRIGRLLLVLREMRPSPVSGASRGERHRNAAARHLLAILFEHRASHLQRCAAP